MFVGSHDCFVSFHVFPLLEGQQNSSLCIYLSLYQQLLATFFFLNKLLASSYSTTGSKFKKTSTTRGYVRCLHGQKYK